MINLRKSCWDQSDLHEWEPENGITFLEVKDPDGTPESCCLSHQVFCTQLQLRRADHPSPCNTTPLVYQASSHVDSHLSDCGQSMENSNHRGS